MALREDNGASVPDAAFGDPDGSRTEIDDAFAGFVGFDGHSSVGGLAVSGTSSQTRVVVGGKGAGKSRYLRRFAAATLEQPGVYVDEKVRRHSDVVQKDAPSTISVVQISHSVEDRLLTERWSLIWRRAIFRSVVSHLLYSKDLAEYLDEDQRDELENAYTPELYRKFRRPVSIYSQTTEIINATTRSTLPSYLEDYRWHDLEGLVAEILPNMPPLYFYIDAIDDEYAHSPLYWLRCQKGLFYTVMKLAKDEFFGARLHVVSCVRDHVLSSVLRSEHASRYRDSPYVRSLTWDESSLRFFLRAKLESLPDEYFVQPELRDEHPVAAWLGSEQVWNDEREIEENIEHYLLRHTRLNPRDIVQMGNRLTEQIVMENRLGHRWEERMLREIVGDLASEWGEEQLVICAQQMSADMMPAHAADQDYGEVFTGALAYAPNVSQTLRSFLAEAIGVDHFDREFFDYAREIAAEFFDERTDVFSVLWQNGLLGYGYGDMDTGVERFYRIKEQSDSFLMPYEADFYVLHSCLIDTVGIKPVGQRPVLGFRIMTPPATG
jgi:hypothetical protein